MGGAAMAQRDAEPTDSPLGIAIASGAVLGSLIDALIDQGTISRVQANGIVLRALTNQSLI